MHRDYATAKAKGDALGYIAVFALAGIVMSMTSGCVSYRVRAELSGEEIDTHTETIATKKSMPYLCNWYQFADCPKLPEK